MKIQTINYAYNNYKHPTTNKYTQTSNQVNFEKVPRVVTRIAYSTRNPLIKYAKDMFQRSLKASTRRNLPLIPELKDITKKVSIECSPKDSTYVWDINNKNSKKYVICLHGASQNITNVQNLYQAIIDRTKYSVLAVEYRGFGENYNKKVSPKTLVEDTQAAVKYLEEKKKIKNENIYIIGHSMGAYPAAKYVSKRDDLGRLILVSPIGSDNRQPLDVNLWFTKRMPPILRLLFTKFKVLQKPIINFFKIESLIAETKTPIDIIHCKNDRLVKPSASQHLSERCANLHNLMLLKAGGHRMEKNKIDAIISILNGD